MGSPAAQKGQRIAVGVGEMGAASAPDVLVTMALGSCVGVSLWDPRRRNGALAHVMLPRPNARSDDPPPSRFADTAIPAMVECLASMGSPRRRLIAKIVGGAAMFSGDSAISTVGERNLAEVRRTLEELRIPIRAEDTGGSHARTVELHLDSGTLKVRSYAYGIKEL